MVKEFSEFDIKMTRLALELASKGVGQVSPSPLVGCVIVSALGEIAGKGTYIYENVTHAEIIALEQAGPRAIGGTAYVSLEPHSYHGRTKPCTDALINAGIKRVVCPIEDPNPMVSGKGFDVLKENGIEVVTRIMREEAARLNEKFCVWHQKNRPFVHLKMAMSLDGRISTDKTASTRITGNEASARVQDLRHEYDAILVGGNTALIDNPLLTDRSEKTRRRNLVRIILDNGLKIPIESKLVQTAKEYPTLVFSKSVDTAKIEKLNECKVEVVDMDSYDLNSVLDELKKRNLQSVLVEGGTAVAGSFIDAKLVDKITFFFAPFLFGGQDAPVAIGGLGAEIIDDALRLKNLEFTGHGDDYEVTGYPFEKDEC